MEKQHLAVATLPASPPEHLNSGFGLQKLMVDCWSHGCAGAHNVLDGEGCIDTSSG